MRLCLTALVMLSLLSACANGSGPRDRPLAANPSAIVAAELGFARLAQDKGQWTAFRETAHKDAVMFVPQRVKARDWLNGRANPAKTVQWKPFAVYSSCDGTAGATTGGTQRSDGSVGYYTTIWLRDPKGKLEWVLDHGDTLATPRAEPEFIASKKAKCGDRPAVGITVAGEGDDMAVGLSHDQTMSWTSIVRPDGSRRIIVRLWDGKVMQPVIDDQVAAR